MGRGGARGPVEESRHELDERVLAVAPDYADAVRRELTGLTTAPRAAVSVLVVFLLLRARTRAPRPPEDREAQRRRRLSRLETATQAGQDRLLDAFERLPDEDREALQAEYAAALAVLRERGLDATPAGDEPLPGSALLERRSAGIARLEAELPPR